jgi:uroporphyrinogen-III synthase
MTSQDRRLIWITRAEPGAAATAERLRAMGCRPLVLPLLEVAPLAGVVPDLTGVGALAFTSANGVRVFASLNPDRRLPVFVVGQATAQAARAAGFRQVYSADGDVDALARGLVGRAGEFRGSVLHLSAAEPAGDLVGALARAGVSARSQAIYETHPLTPSRDELERALKAEAVLLHSPRAARQLALLLRGREARHLRALCLSRAVARPLARAKIGERAFAPLPMEAALLNLIERTAPAAAASVSP